MKKKTIIVLSIIVAAVLVLAGIGIGIYAHIYGQQDHADAMSVEDRYQYNYALTAFGRNSGRTSNSEVLIVDSITKKLGGDTEVIFYIYRFEKESDLSAALYMTAEEIAENSSYEYMGFGSVTLVDDSFAGMTNMRTVYVK